MCLPSSQRLKDPHHKPIRSLRGFCCLSCLAASTALYACVGTGKVEDPAGAGVVAAGETADPFFRLSSSAWRSLTSDARRGIAVGFERIMADSSVQVEVS